MDPKVFIAAEIDLDEMPVAVAEPTEPSPYEKFGGVR